MNKLDTKSGLDAILVNALINSTKDILSTMGNLQVQVKNVKAQQDYASSGDLSAVIAILGEHGEGMLSLSFSIELANLIVSKLLGTPASSVTSEDRSDGIGELVNMISGNVKTTLSRESGNSYSLSLPTIILGKGHEVQARPKNSPYLHITFEVEGQQFDLQVSFKFN